MQWRNGRSKTLQTHQTRFCIRRNCRRKPGDSIEARGLWRSKGASCEGRLQGGRVLEGQQVACHCGTQAAAAAVSTMLWHSACNLQFSTSSLANARRWRQQLGLQGFGSGEKRINPSSPCQTLSLPSFLPSVLKAHSLRPVVLGAGPYYRVVHQVLRYRQLSYASVPLIHPI